MYHSMILAFCEAEEIGDINFKGIYHFNKTRVLDSITFYCQYGSIKSPNIQLQRHCLYNDKLIGSWEPLDLKECAPRSKITEELIKLNKVTINKLFSKS